MKNRHVLTGKAHHFGSFWGSLQFGETCFFLNGKPPWVHVIPSLPNAAPAGQVLPTSSRPGAAGGTIGCHWNITISSIIFNLSTGWLPATARWFSMILLQHPLGDINMTVSGRPDLTSCPKISQSYLVLATLNHVGWVMVGPEWRHPLRKAIGPSWFQPAPPTVERHTDLPGWRLATRRRVWDWLPVGVANTTLLLSLL